MLLPFYQGLMIQQVNSSSYPEDAQYTFDEILAQNMLLSEDHLMFAKLPYQSQTNVHDHQLLRNMLSTQMSGTKPVPIKSYKCDWCSYSTARKDNLNVHCRRHTGEKPYTCKYCQRGFADKSNYNVHIRRHLTDGDVIFQENVPLKRSFS